MATLIIATEHKLLVMSSLLIHATNCPYVYMRLLTYKLKIVMLLLQQVKIHWAIKLKSHKRFETLITIVKGKKKEYEEEIDIYKLGSWLLERQRDLYSNSQQIAYLFF